MPRKSGWSWKYICCLPGWIVRLRIAVLKQREQTEDIKGEIADCEQQLSYIEFIKSIKLIVKTHFGYPIINKSPNL